jgi:LysR family nitrogen assimilation transcriptional regulator
MTIGMRTGRMKDKGARQPDLPQTRYVSARSVRQLPLILKHPGWTLRQLQIILAIAELGSLSKASERLHVAQPALSRHLRLIEQGLGVTIFARKPRGMEITPAGVLLVDGAANILRQLDDLRADLMSIGGEVVGQLVFAIPPILADEFGARVISQFKATFPKVSLRLVTGFSGHVAEWLQRAEVDIAVIYDGPKTVNLDSQPVMSERLFLIGDKKAALSMRRSHSFRSLAEKPLILSGAQHTPRFIVEEIAAKLGVELNVVLEADSTRVAKTLVASGHGFTIMPMSSVYQEVRSKTLSIAPIINPIPTCRMILASAVGKPPSAVVKYLTKTIKDEIKSLLSNGVCIGTPLDT